MVLLEETKRNFEKDIGFTLEEVEKMDLCEIEKMIHTRKDYNPVHDPMIYRKSRDPLIAMGVILTAEEHEKNIQKSLKKYKIKSN